MPIYYFLTLAQVGASLEERAGKDLRPLGEGGAVPHLVGGEGGGQEGVHPEQVGRHRPQTQETQEGKGGHKGTQAQAPSLEIDNFE